MAHAAFGREPAAQFLRTRIMELKLRAALIVAK